MNASESSFPVDSSGGGNIVERLTPPFVLTEAKIEDAHQRREYATRFGQKCR